MSLFSLYRYDFRILKKTLREDSFDVYNVLVRTKMNQDAYKRGEEDAKSDISKKNYRIFWQVRGGWGELLKKLLNVRFGVEIIQIGCFSWEEKSSYEMGYNTTVRAYLAQTFGVDAFEKTLEEIEEYRSKR